MKTISNGTPFTNEKGSVRRESSLGTLDQQASALLTEQLGFLGIKDLGAFCMELLVNILYKHLSLLIITHEMWIILEVCL